ncbi:MAG TPA: hypothetical protein DCF84_08455 [Bacteroidetes bacterium]|nr:hypothetical protein [Bacteroidota bacterium]|tara:strand:- start:899 stop:1321 length:423 start_codon:yes stop_codon:yes gene_type:complete
MLKGPAVSDIMVDVDFSDSLDVTQLLNHEFERINEIDFISLRYAKSDDEQLSIKSIILTYDLDGGKPLYQVDLMFSSTQDAYKMAYDFYGLPNYANHGNVLNEWYFRQPNNLSDIWITLSTNTLVIRALEPNTVWEAKVY